MASPAEEEGAALQREWDWVASVPGVDAEAATRARNLFHQYNVDEVLLDFLASEQGLKLLTAHRRRRGTGGHASSGGKGGKGNALHGRQKISAGERRGEAHYFAAKPRQGTKGALASVQTKQSGKQQLPFPAKLEVELETSRHQGSIKSYESSTGYGFICSEAIEPDIFLHRKDVPAGTEALPGRLCSFELIWANGRPQARQLHWIGDEPLPVPDTWQLGNDSARREGWLKKIGPQYAFLSEDVEGLENVFVAQADLPQQIRDGCFSEEDWLGSRVSYELAFDGQRRPQAKNVGWHGDPVDDTDASECSSTGEGRAGIQRW